MFTAYTMVLGKTNMHTYTQINKHQTNNEETSLQKGTINLRVYIYMQVCAGVQFSVFDQILPAITMKKRQK